MAPLPLPNHEEQEIIPTLEQQVNFAAVLYPQIDTLLPQGKLLLTSHSLRRSWIFRQAHTEGPIPPVPFALAVIHTKLSTATRRRYGTKSFPLSRTESTKYSQCATDGRSVPTGNELLVVPVLATTTVTYAPAVLRHLTELGTVLEQRKLQALTPYNPEAWESLLLEAGIFDKYPHLPQSMRTGFQLNLPKITITQTPPNKTTIVELADQFNKIVNLEIIKQRYLGPLTRKNIELLIGPFQSSPFSIIPKSGRPDHFRILQNYSFPHNPSLYFPNPSINSFVNSDNFPSTWGTFPIISLLIHRLPPNSQVATRDVAEAYRTIPLHPSQWPGAVTRIGEDAFCIDTSTCFGVSSSAGVYGVVADAGADLFRYRGIGPLAKWVDDHIFFRIRREYLTEYNQRRLTWHSELSVQGQRHNGGRLWYGGTIFPDGTLDEHVEDCRFPCIDLSAHSPRSIEDQQYTYNFDDIDQVSDALGIPWEHSKDTPFASSTTYIGLQWDLETLMVSLGIEKRKKYITNIEEWLQRPVHVLNDVQQLYGRLLHACLIVTTGRAYLTGLEAMLGLCNNRPFVPHSPIRGIADDLSWWSSKLRQSSVSRSIPAPVDLIDPNAFSDASSGIGIAIIIDDKWRAWRLIPGWQTLDGKRDIGWAEAVGFELLIRTITRFIGTSGHIKVYGDNKGVVEGWWNNRSRNKSINGVFRRIHSFLENFDDTFSIHTTYVPSKFNPADGPSRGIYPSVKLLLPEIQLPSDLDRFIIDSTLPYSPTELRLFREGRYPPALAKCIDDSIRGTNPDKQSHSIGFDENTHYRHHNLPHQF